MKRNGPVRLYLIFARYTVHPERRTTSGRTGTNRRRDIEGLSDLSWRPHMPSRR